MKYLCLPILLTLIFPALTFAQNYKEGYVVTQKGDTLKGYIYHGKLEENPREVLYKSTGMGTVQKLALAQVKSFEFIGLEKFERYDNVHISLDVTYENKLGSGRDTSFKVDTVFLEALLQDKNAGLYAYTDKLKDRFYLSTPGNATPQELVYRLYYPTGADDFNRNTQVENTYKKQLSALALQNNMLDKGMITLIDKTGYTRAGILEVVGKISHVSKAAVAKKSGKPIGIIGLIALGTFIILAILNKTVN